MRQHQIEAEGSCDTKVSVGLFRGGGFDNVNTPGADCCPGVTQNLNLAADTNALFIHVMYFFHNQPIFGQIIRILAQMCLLFLITQPVWPLHYCGRWHWSA